VESLGNVEKYAATVQRAEEVFASLVGHVRIDIATHGDIPLSNAGWAQFVAQGTWKNLREMCAHLDLDLELDQIDRIQQLASNGHARLSELDRATTELKNRFADQLKRRWFLYIRDEQTRYWENETLFGEEVIDKIPEAVADIYEAGSCFAVGRAGGTVYHCMGIMQAALFKVGEQLGCTINLDVDDWGSVEKKIKESVDALRVIAVVRKGDVVAWAQWQKQDEEYAELLSDLNAVKKAWRHPSAHFRQKYTVDQARKVLEKVEDFTKHAATLLP